MVLFGSPWYASFWLTLTRTVGFGTSRHVSYRFGGEDLWGTEFPTFLINAGLLALVNIWKWSIQSAEGKSFHRSCSLPVDEKSLQNEGTPFHSNLHLMRSWLTKQVLFVIFGHVRWNAVLLSIYVATVARPCSMLLPCGNDQPLRVLNKVQWSNLGRAASSICENFCTDTPVFFSMRTKNTAKWLLISYLGDKEPPKMRGLTILREAILLSLILSKTVRNRFCLPLFTASGRQN